MPQSYTVRQITSKPLREIPGDWTSTDYYNILELAEYGDTSDLSEAEVADIAKMALADLPKDESATLLINYVFPAGALTKGQVQNCAHEMDTESLWEEYAEPAYHRMFYRVGSLLYSAYNGGFPKPDGHQLKLRVTAAKPAGKELLANPEPAFLLRLLAPGMDGHALLHRLYEDQLKGAEFPEAEAIVWEAESVADGDDYLLTLTSSAYWFKDYNPIDSYEATAWDDVVPEED